MDTNPASLLHLQRTLRARLDRESTIPDEDIEQAVKQIIDFPFLGGRKGSLKLQEDEKALLGQTVYKEIKQQLRLEAEKELFKGKEQSELEKNQYKRLLDKGGPYETFAPGQKHDVWAIDFVTFVLYGMYFSLCVVYEVYSQAYLAITVSESACSEVAMAAVKSACEFAGVIPKRYLLSDNGPPLICSDFEALLEALEIAGKQIPPGQPWHNGALESGNRDLKKVLYTIAFQDACKDVEISLRGTSRHKIFDCLENYCCKAQKVINEQIVRPKFTTTPMAVLTDQVDEKRAKRRSFIKKKTEERKQRMALLKKQGGSKRKRIEDKVKAAWQKTSAKMSCNEIFAFCELVSGRYKAITT